MEFLKNKSILIAFLLPALFWIYLIPTSSMFIENDARNYRDQAAIIHEEGWVAFFKEGPLREPLYTASVALSMRAGSLLNVPYQKVQTVLQVLILLLSQCLLYQLLKKLRIRPVVSAMILLYFGLSPAILNSTFSLYSEIISYPFVIGIMLIAHKLLHVLLEEKPTAAVSLTVVMALLAAVVTLSKAIFEYIFPLFLLPYVFLILLSLHRRKVKRAIIGILVVGIFLTAFKGILNSYKSFNLKYNGHFAITNERGADMFYHYAMRRTAPLTKELLLVGVLSVPGEKVCRSVLPEACHDWWWNNYGLTSVKTEELRTQGVSSDQIKSSLLRAGFVAILKNPLQYGLFTSFEAIKMLLWESTQVGYVRYPEWLQTIYNNVVFKNALRLAVFLITSLAFLYGSIYLIRERRHLRSPAPAVDRCYTLMLLIIYFIVIFNALYASVITIVRYAFPIVPLYMACIAFMLDRVSAQRKH